MKMLAIETSCDETAAAVVENLKVLSSVKYTQEVHRQWGGVVPSLAKRGHEERIDQIIDKALGGAGVSMREIGAVAVTVGPGLAVALEVGVKKAKELCKEWGVPLVAVNHVEGHVMSALADGQRGINIMHFPCLGLVVSGGHTQVIEIVEIGKYRVLAESLDDDIGEALDKGARMLGLPYPGGAELEKLAREGESDKYPLPLPMKGREGRSFSYSGLKTAMYRLVERCKEKSGNLDDSQRADLAASFQNMVFLHLIRILRLVARRGGYRELIVGGGVVANRELRNRLEDLGRELGMNLRYPADSSMCTDNAAMIGIAGELKWKRSEYYSSTEVDMVDRLPRWRVGQD